MEVINERKGKGATGYIVHFTLPGIPPLETQRKRKLSTSGYQTTIRLLYHVNPWSVSVGCEPTGECSDNRDWRPKARSRARFSLVVVGVVCFVLALSRRSTFFFP